MMNTLDATGKIKKSQQRKIKRHKEESNGNFRTEKHNKQK